MVIACRDVGCEVQLGKAIFAGLLAAAFFSLATAAGRALGAPVNLELLLGSAVTREVGLGSWLLGFLLQEVLGGAFAIGYAALFEYVVRAADAVLGVILSLVHLLVAGLLVSALGEVHPLVPAELADPGLWYARGGSFAVATFLLAHLVFGAIVGGVYRPVRAEHRGALLA